MKVLNVISLVLIGLIFILSIFLIGVLTGISFSQLEYTTNHNININISGDEETVEYIKSLENIVKYQSNKNSSEKINCISKALYWDYEQEKYIEDQNYFPSINCYEVKDINPFPLNYSLMIE